MIWTHLLICFVSDTSPIEHAINQAAVFLEDAAKVTNFTSTVNMYFVYCYLPEQCWKYNISLNPEVILLDISAYCYCALAAM